MATLTGSRGDYGKILGQRPGRKLRLPTLMCRRSPVNFYTCLNKHVLKLCEKLVKCWKKIKCGKHGNLVFKDYIDSMSVKLR